MEQLQFYRVNKFHPLTPQSRVVIKDRRPGTFPGYYEHDPAYFCRKIEEK